jgi:hypothetical protein
MALELIEHKEFMQIELTRFELLKDFWTTCREIPSGGKPLKTLHSKGGG